MTGYTMRAVHKETGEIQDNYLRRLHSDYLRSATSFDEAQQWVKEWNEYNRNWDYSVLVLDPKQRVFDLGD